MKKDNGLSRFSVFVLLAIPVIGIVLLVLAVFLDSKILLVIGSIMIVLGLGIFVLDNEHIKY